MNHYQRRLERLQRELERRQQARGGRPEIKVIEIWDGDELVEVMPLGAKVIAVVNVDIDKL